MKELLSILNATARRLGWSRRIEMGSAGLLGAAGASALLELHAWGMAHDRWHLTGLTLLLGAALSAAAATVTFVIAALRERPWRANLRIASTTALVVLVAGWLSLRSESFPAWALPLAALPAGALLGVIAARRGPSPELTGRYLDRRFALKERASTAAELIAQGREREPWSQCVFAQALTALQREQVLAQPIELPRMSMGMAALGALLCLMLAILLPDKAVPKGDDLAVRVSAALPEMTNRQRQELAAMLLKAAEEAADMPAREANLQRAAQAARQGDPQEMRKALELLAEAGLEIRKVIPKDLSAIGGDGPTPGAGTATTPKTPATSESIAATTPAASSAPNYVRVMNPEYATMAATSEPPKGSDATVPWNQAWELARARAMQTLAAGQVPSRHRQLVRDFFAGQGTKE